MEKLKIDRLKKSMNTDKLLITSKNDIYYYTGLMTEGFLIIRKKDKPLLLVSSLFNEISSKNIEISFLEDGKDLTKRLQRSTVGFDETNLKAGIYLRLKKSGIKLKPSANIIKNQRQVKSDREIETIQKSIETTQKVFKRLDFWGKTELQVRDKILELFLRYGVGKAYDPIVASGKNTQYIHYTPKKSKISSVVLVDMGARYNYYNTDMTRMFFTRIPRSHRKIIEDAMEIQKTLIDSMHAGQETEDIQKLYEDMMQRKRYKVRHRFGHSIGLGVHESVDELKTNMILAVEPGIYVKNIGGARIEDMILIKKDKAKVLTTFTQQQLP